MELALAPQSRRCTKGDIMSENMKRKPRRSSPRGGAAKHELPLHEHSKHFDDIAAEIHGMERKDVRDLLTSYGINPDESVQRLKSTMDNALAAVRRGHHPEKTMIGTSAGRGVVFAAAGLRPLFLADELRAAGSTHAALAAMTEGFQQLGVEADAVRIHCAADPDAVLPLSECIHTAAVAIADREELWQPFASAYAALAWHMSPVQRRTFVRSVHERLEADPVPAALLALLDEVASAPLVASASEGAGPH